MAIVRSFISRVNRRRSTEPVLVSPWKATSYGSNSWIVSLWKWSESGYVFGTLSGRYQLTRHTVLGSFSALYRLAEWGFLCGQFLSLRRKNERAWRYLGEITNAWDECRVVPSTRAVLIFPRRLSCTTYRGVQSPFLVLDAFFFHSSSFHSYLLRQPRCFNWSREYLMVATCLAVIFYSKARV